MNCIVFILYSSPLHYIAYIFFSILTGSGGMGVVAKALGSGMRDANAEYKTRSIEAATRLVTLQVDHCISNNKYIKKRMTYN